MVPPKDCAEQLCDVLIKDDLGALLPVEFKIRIGREQLDGNSSSQPRCSTLAQGLTHYRGTYRQDGFLRDLLIVFVLTDAFFIVLYTIFGLLKAVGLAPEIPSFQLNAETGLASIWNYGKLMASTTALVLIWKREKGVSLIIMAGLFLFLLLDDFYEIHDHLARTLGERISIDAFDSLHPQNRGELFVYSGILAIAAPLLWFAVKRVTPLSRAFVGALAAGVIMIGLFGVAVDVLHGAIDATLGGFSELIGKIFNRLMTILEDGGEMIAMSVCFWLCLVRLWERPLG